MSSSPSEPDRSHFGHPPDPERTGTAFRTLCETIARLRAPDGCPWDHVQTLDSIKPHTLEEVYELLEAIDSGDDPAIVEELGDVLLQVVLDAQIGRDERRFELADVIEGVTAKLVRRHPHVFGDGEAHTAEDVLRNWEQEKTKEKQRESLLEGVPTDLPALARAARLSKKAARVGYDFPNRDMLFGKLREELSELTTELYETGIPPQVEANVEADIVPDEPLDSPERQARAEEELGDLLFAVANIARRWGINPEDALRKSNAKFVRRFRGIERAARESGTDLSELTLPEMEAIYQAVKRREKTQADPAADE